MSVGRDTVVADKDRRTEAAPIEGRARDTSIDDRAAEPPATLMHARNENGRRITKV
jgi:hypothetical protein